MMNKLVAHKLLLVAGAAALIAALAHPTRTIHAQSGCTVASLTGPYGYRMTGNYYDNQGYTYFYSSAGRLTLDGTGAISSGSETQNIDGAVAHREFTGTYTVNEDCTGNITMQNATSVLHGDIVLVSGGKEVNFVETDRDIIFSGTMKAQ